MGGKKETLLCLGAVNLRDFEGKRKHDIFSPFFPLEKKQKNCCGSIKNVENFSPF